MPFIKIYIHLVWATKNRTPLLTKEIRHKVFRHMKEYGESKSIHVDSVNGYLEHVHLLVSLNSDQNIATIVNLIKGESSHWINKNNLTTSNFGWQDEYFAVSVSRSHIERVRNYIFRQEEHHSLKNWSDEYDEFITKYGFEKG